MRFGPQQSPPLANQKTHLFLDAVFAPDECERLVLHARRVPEQAGRLTGSESAHGVRRCRVRWLPEVECFAWVHDRLIGLVAAANREHFGFDVWGMDERLQLLEYGARGRGFFDWHCDRGRTGIARNRKLSVSVQLSDGADYRGGSLELNPDGTPLAAPRERGNAVVFASHLLHRVTPVTGGRRIALTAWFHGPHFR